MQSLSFAASTHATNVASQLYLWIVSRIDMAKLVQRSILAAHNLPGPVKMVLTEYRYGDRLPQGIPVHTAMRVYGGPALVSLIVPGTQAYIRRKPTAQGLSADTYQVVVQWNVVPHRPVSEFVRPANSDTVRPPPLVIPPVPVHIARGPPSPIRTAPPPGGSPRPLFNSPAHSPRVSPSVTSDVEDFQVAPQ